MPLGPDVAQITQYLQQLGASGLQVANALDQLAQPLGSLKDKMRDLDRAWWEAMTPAQRRRAAKRLIREEQWQQYMEKHRVEP